MPSATIDIEAMYRKFAPMVYRRVLSFYDPDEAEEIVHEIFIKVIERADQFRQESSPTTWLYSITTNHCINRLCKSRRREAIVASRREELAAPSRRRAPQLDLLFWRQMREAIDDELLEIAVLYYLDGLDQHEIAKRYGVSRRTIGNRLEELRRQAHALAEHA